MEKPFEETTKKKRTYDRIGCLNIYGTNVTAK